MESTNCCKEMMLAVQEDGLDVSKFKMCPFCGETDGGVYPLRNVNFFFWKAVHNIIVHPLLGLPWEPNWVMRFHDWTANKCYKKTSSEG